MPLKEAKMRIINLDETGIKIIAANRKSMYLSLREVKDFLERKYTLSENLLKLNNKQLLLTDSDLEEFDTIYNYIDTIFKKGN